MQRTLLAGLLLSIIVVIFALQNSGAITLQLWLWEVEGSLAIILLTVILFGAVLGILFSYSSIFKRNKEIKRLKKQVKQLQKDLEEERTEQSKVQPDNPQSPGTDLPLM